MNLQTAEVVINLDIPWNPAVLEQRIARVHRLGQGRHVRVINFITKDTIEERILNLLNFKKSLLEGVLDNGDDQVFLDEDKFKKIMDVVDSLSNPPFEPTQPETGEITEPEAYGDSDSKFITDKASEKAADTQDTTDEENALNEKTPRGTNDSIQQLFVSGLDFLQKLGNTLSNNHSTKEIVASLVHKDDSTGKISINIPVQDESTIEKVADVLDTFLKLFSQKK